MNGTTSVAVRLLSRGIDAVACAWRYSIARQLTVSVLGAANIRGRSDRIGIAVTATGATALTTRLFATTPLPFTWIVPGCALVAGLMLVSSRD